MSLKLSHAQQSAEGGVAESSPDLLTTCISLGDAQYLGVAPVSKDLTEEWDEDAA